MKTEELKQEMRKMLKSYLEDIQECNCNSDIYGTLEALIDDSQRLMTHCE